jgi:hypothetical protein
LNFFRKPPNNTFWKIPTENSVGDSLCNWHDEQCSQFTDGITEGIYVGKNDTSSFFFLLCFKIFFHGNSVGIYRGNISVGKIPRKFTDENIPSVFPFVFINFLVVFILKISYSHHVYMDNGVYNKWSTWDIIHSLLVHRHVPKFDEIPFFDENFSKWRYINCLLELEAYFYFNKILYYIKKKSKTCHTQTFLWC